MGWPIFRGEMLDSRSVHINEDGNRGWLQMRFWSPRFEKQSLAKTDHWKTIRTIVGLFVNSGIVIWTKDLAKF